jgi:hypothetical protein
MKENRQLWVYDIETLFSAWTYTGFNIDTLEVVQYVLHKDRDDREALMDHLRSCKGQIGFNNLNFDYPIIHYFMTKLYNKQSPIEVLICDLYTEAQRIIEEQNKPQFNTIVAIRQKDVLIPQLDLFKIWHYNNKARATSLKSLEISMNYPNVMEMEISHKKEDITLEEVSHILEYNLNDVMATYEFYKKTEELGKIDLRKKIIEKFNLPCLNWNNGKIGEQLILKLYCEKTNKNPWEVKELRSKTDIINLKDCIPDNIEFNTNIFKKVYDSFYNKIINILTVKQDKASKVTSILYKDCVIDYGLGGVHGVTKSGIYESDEKYIIKTADVASLYPNLPIAFQFYIRHLGPEFLEVYKDNIVDVRLAEKQKPKKEQDKAIVDGYKEAANVPYGKSNEATSFLYDPLYTMKTTVSGQLSLSVLMERLGENIPDLKLLMFNTDGFEVKIPREHEKLYYEICNTWEKEFKLVLEFDNYSKMWIRDVNNYGCVTESNKIKNKGAFEVDKVIGAEPAYHKDNSFRIVPLALQEYFTKGTPIEQTILNHTNIYDFCGRQKFGRDSRGKIHYIGKDKDDYPVEVVEKQQKNVRYFITKKGATFIKYYSKGTTEFINKGYQVTIFNKYVEMDMKDYNINYNYYIKEAQKEINNIEDKQLSLF